MGIHTFRDFSIYEEEARRMTIVCSDKDAKVSSEYLSVNEWALVRELDATRRRKLHDMTDVDEVARQLKRDVPRMSTVNTMKFAERTHAAQPFEWEYGMPPSGATSIDTDQGQERRGTDVESFG